ncbi:DHS-like NAD/FAD-binding domain-containing protein, partial [Ceratobasidium sp. AG-I]
LAEGKRMVLIAGAGISTASGLPDFRSHGGLYNSPSQSSSGGINARKALDAVNQRLPGGLKQSNQLLSDIFFKAKSAKPTHTHWLIKEIHSLGLLRRYYTQNIDGLDEDLDIPIVDFGAHQPEIDGKIVQLHGSIRWLKCTKCSWRGKVTPEYLEDSWSRNQAVACEACPRVSSHGRPLSPGCLRSDVLLYGDPHPFGQEVAESFQEDISAPPDVLLVMGTSLTTTRSSSLVEIIGKLAKAVRRTPSGVTVYVNNQPPPSSTAHIFDYHLSVDLDMW